MKIKDIFEKIRTNCSNEVLNKQIDTIIKELDIENVTTEKVIEKLNGKAEVAQELLDSIKSEVETELEKVKKDVKTGNQVVKIKKFNIKYYEQLLSKKIHYFQYFDMLLDYRYGGFLSEMSKEDFDKLFKILLDMETEKKPNPILRKAFELILGTDIVERESDYISIITNDEKINDYVFDKVCRVLDYDNKSLNQTQLRRVTILTELYFTIYYNALINIDDERHFFLAHKAILNYGINSLTYISDYNDLVTFLSENEKSKEVKTYTCGEELTTKYGCQNYVTSSYDGVVCRIPFRTILGYRNQIITYVLPDNSLVDINVEFGVNELIQYDDDSEIMHDILNRIDAKPYRKI